MKFDRDDDFLTPDEMLELVGPAVGGHTIKEFDGRPKPDPFTGILGPLECRFPKVSYCWDGWTETWVRRDLFAQTMALAN